MGSQDREIALQPWGRRPAAAHRGALDWRAVVRAVVFAGLIFLTNCSPDQSSSPTSVLVSPTASTVVPGPGETLPPTTPGAPPPTILPSTPPTTASPPRLPKRHDVPPEGIKRQLSFAGRGGGSGGWSANLSPGQQDVYMATIEIAELGDLIFQDLASNLDAVAEFTNPYGYAHKIETTTVQGVADFQWIIFPGEPLGVYHIKLSQGQQQATGTFTVRRATTYHATALPQQAPAGATFWVALAGLAPNTALPLYLYQRLAGTSVYLTALPNVTTNANGEALATLTTQPADAPGDYLIVTSLDLPGASLSVVNGTGPPPTDVTPIPLDQVSPLQRHDTPPPGVDSRVRFDLASSPVLVADSVLTWMGPVEVADPAFKISLDGFEANKPVVAEFTYPNGHIELETRTANSIGYVGGLDWRSMPGEPLGQYQVTATQGMRQARGTFRMQRATHPHVGVLPVSGRPGTTFRIGLAGFPPGSGVPLYLYYADQYNAEYVRALPVTQTDAHGEATLTLATAADDPKGIYGIVTRDQATINSEDYEYTKVSLIRPQP